MGGLCLAAEIFDWRRFPRGAVVHVFHRAGALGALDRPQRTSRQHHPRRQPPRPRPARRSRLVLSASAPRRRRHQGARQEGLAPEVIARAWNAQVRLSSRFRQLGTRKNIKSVVAAAIARELAGFLWAEMTTDCRLIMTTLEHHAIGAALLEASATRRDTASAEPIPAGITAHRTPRRTDAHIPGHPSAYDDCDLDSRTPLWRSPIHDVPARRRPLSRPPPPASRGTRSSRHPGVKVVRPRCAAGAPP